MIWLLLAQPPPGYLGHKADELAKLPTLVRGLELEHGQACLVVPVLQVGVRYPGHALLSPPTADKALATKLTRWVGTGHQVRHGALQPWVKSPWPRSTCSINSSL